MTTQRALRLTLPALTGESSRSWHERNFLFKHPTRHKSPETLLAELLKRQGRSIMGDLTECPPAAVPHHLARLSDWRDIVQHHLRHTFAESPEHGLSGAQLASPHTLADYLAAAEITRQQHRAPCFVNHRDAELQEINRKLDVLAGLLGKPQIMEAIGVALESEAER